MEERAWVERPDRQMRFRIRRSSCDRGWRGFEAYLYEASEGYSEAVFVQHSLSMHVGQPVLVTSRCDGAHVHRLQAPGDLKVVPAGYSRVWEIAAPTMKFVVDLAPWFVREVAQGMGINGERVAISPQLHLRDKRMEHVAWALLSEMESGDALGRLYAESLGTALAAQLLRRSGPAVPRRTSGLPKSRLQRVTDYVHEHLARDLSLHELARIAGMSASHFNAQFRQSTGMPVHQYVIAARVDTALHLLIQTALPVSDIALRVGFSSQSHLSRHLRRMHGLSPAALRREAL
jgi:AraC family transcriptional regulator